MLTVIRACYGAVPGTALTTLLTVIRAYYGAVFGAALTILLTVIRACYGVVFGAALLCAAPALASSQAAFSPPAGFTHGDQTINHVKLHYVKGGQGPLVMLVHGFGQSWYEWRTLMPLLAAQHTVIAVDLPGLGDSAPSATGYTGEAIAEYLYQLALQHSRGHPFSLVAHDIGIWNTYPLAVKHQRHINKVVFMEAPIPDKSLYEFPAFSPQGESLVWHFSLFAAGDDLAEMLIAGREKQFLTHFIRSHATRQDAFTPQLLDGYAAAYAQPASLHASFAYYRALNQSIAQNARLAQHPLSMPVMAIGGGGHGGMGQFQVAQMRHYATEVTGHVLPGCGHWLPEECPATLNPLVVAFLAP